MRKEGGTTPSRAASPNFTWRALGPKGPVKSYDHKIIARIICNLSCARLYCEWGSTPEQTSFELPIWHKQCFKCQVCNMTLNMRNYKGFDKRPYCEA
ncbi:Uncharacterized protein GBIM_18218 [Gryllus bimaculatus]|nr:Uncharacterized protein GBIM_18218 [Gryllus bimaculatus]